VEAFRQKLPGGEWPENVPVAERERAERLHEWQVILREKVIKLKPVW
jgi:hypothetical protein